MSKKRDIQRWLVNQVAKHPPSELKAVYTQDGDSPRVEKVELKECDLHPDGSFDGVFEVEVGFDDAPPKSYEGRMRGTYSGHVEGRLSFAGDVEDSIP